MKILLVLALVGVTLFALAWWTSGRSRRSLRMSGDHEVAKSQGIARGHAARQQDAYGPL